MVTLESQMHNAQELSRLSGRERSILDLAIKGFKDRAIADQLGISTGTVGTYWTRIRRKMGPVTRAQIAAVVGRIEGSNGGNDEAHLKLAELCERLEAETARRRAAERYLQMLRRLATGVARYTTAGRRTELVIGTADAFEDVESDAVGFSNAARTAEVRGTPVTFLSYRLISLGPGEVLVAKLA
jgi:DNA-binding CsgD family transcriptional regulator